MSTSGDDLGRLVADMVDTLRDIEGEFEPRTERGRIRPPTPRELLRLTSDVAIPGAILVLRTNIEALKLLQRALRMADGRPPTGSDTDVRGRAERLSRTTLSRLDDALADLQDAVEGRPEDEQARELLDDARHLRREIESRIEPAEPDRTESPEGDEAHDVRVDVDAELESLKDEFDGDAEDGDDGDDDGT